MSGTGEVGMAGQAPIVRVIAGNPEAAKYSKLWDKPEYRLVSPGERLAPVFLGLARPKPGAEVIDFGCGTGRAALMLAILGSCKVTLVDFVRNCLDPEVRQALETQADTLRFLKADLEQPLPIAAAYGFCADVMEHIPPDRVERTLQNILLAAHHVFFSIALTDDEYHAALIGEPIHLTLRPYEWWLTLFQRLKCVVHYSGVVGATAHFYVTAWPDAGGHVIVDHAELNVPEEQIAANIRYNIAQGWTQVCPHETNDLEVAILGGGPSLPSFLDDIRKQKARGVKIVTLNGTYNWALEQGLDPVTQIIIDARQFNARFVTPVMPGCLYLICSQCDPSVFEGLPTDRTYIWHTATEAHEAILKAQYDLCWPVPGGTTVLLRAIPLLRMLGYTKFHLYGCDSCLMDGAHHAYAQPENDEAGVMPVMVNDGRTYWGHAWMIAQAQQFIDLIRVFGDEINLAVYGDGLLAHILNTGAELELGT